MKKNIRPTKRPSDELEEAFTLCLAEVWHKATGSKAKSHDKGTPFHNFLTDIVKKIGYTKGEYTIDLFSII